MKAIQLFLCVLMLVGTGCDKSPKAPPASPNQPATAPTTTPSALAASLTPSQEGVLPPAWPAEAQVAVLELRNANSRLEQALEAVQKDLKSADGDLADLADQANEDVRGLKLDLAKAQASNELLSANNQKLHESLQSLADSSRAGQSDLALRLEESLKTVDNLRRANVRLNAAVQDSQNLQQALGGLRQDNANLVRTLQDRDTQIDQMQRALQDLQKRLQQADFGLASRRELAAQAQQIRELSSQLQRRQRQEDEQAGELARAVREKAELAENLARSQRQVQAMEEELRSLRTGNHDRDDARSDNDDRKPRIVPLPEPRPQEPKIIIGDDRRDEPKVVKVPENKTKVVVKVDRKKVQRD